MDIGLIFTGADMTMAELTATGQRAEQSGVASLYLAEAWRSGWMPLTALAAATTRVRLGPYVLNA